MANIDLLYQTIPNTYNKYDRIKIRERLNLEFPKKIDIKVVERRKNFKKHPPRSRSIMIKKTMEEKDLVLPPKKIRSFLDKIVDKFDMKIKIKKFDYEGEETKEEEEELTLQQIFNDPSPRRRFARLKNVLYQIRGSPNVNFQRTIVQNISNQELLIEEIQKQLKMIMSTDVDKNIPPDPTIFISNIEIGKYIDSADIYKMFKYFIAIEIQKEVFRKKIIQITKEQLEDITNQTFQNFVNNLIKNYGEEEKFNTNDFKKEVVDYFNKFIHSKLVETFKIEKEKEEEKKVEEEKKEEKEEEEEEKRIKKKFTPQQGRFYYSKKSIMTLFNENEIEGVFSNAKLNKEWYERYIEPERRGAVLKDIIQEMKKREKNVAYYSFRKPNKKTFYSENYILEQIKEDKFDILVLSEDSFRLNRDGVFTSPHR